MAMRFGASLLGLSCWCTSLALFDTSLARLAFQSTPMTEATCVGRLLTFGTLYSGSHEYLEGESGECCWNGKCVGREVAPK